jgi:hypothetical protein
MSDFLCCAWRSCVVDSNLTASGSQGQSNGATDTPGRASHDSNARFNYTMRGVCGSELWPGNAHNV